MPGRRRQKRTEASKIDATPPWEQRVREDTPATTGPFDERDAPDDELPRVDLGALRIPVGEGFDIRVDLDESQQVVSATLAGPDGTMQLGVFAAPRNEGIWDDVRGEIAQSLNAQRKGSAQDAAGAFGTELHGAVPDESGRGSVRVRRLATASRPSKRAKCSFVAFCNPARLVAGAVAACKLPI